LMRMMAREPGQRYQTPADLAAALAAVSTGVAPATPPPPNRTLPPPPSAAAIAATPAVNSTGATWDLPSDGLIARRRLTAPPAGKRGCLAWARAGAAAVVAALVLVLELRSRSGNADDKKGGSDGEPPKAKQKPTGPATGYYARSVKGKDAVPLRFLDNGAV